MEIGSFLSGFGSAATKNTFEEKYKVDTLEKDKINKENMDTIAMLHSISQMPANERPTAIKLIPNKDVRQVAETNNVNLQTAIATEAGRLGMPVSDYMKSLTPDKLALVYQKANEVKIETDNRQKAQGIAATEIAEMQKKIKNLSNMATTDGVTGGGFNEFGGATGTTRPLTEIEKLQKSNEIILETISKLGSDENYKLYIERLGKYIDNNNKRIEEMEKVKETKEATQTITKLGKDSKPHIYKYNSQTNRYDIDEGIAYEKGDIEKETKINEKKEKDLATKINQLKKADIVIGKVDEALKKVGFFTTGAIGETRTYLPARILTGSNAYNLQKTIDTIQSNLGMNELMIMRGLSPSGASGLGQLTEKELDRLESAIASLDIGQGEGQLRKNLKQVKTHYENWKKLIKDASFQEAVGDDISKPKKLQTPSGNTYTITED